MADKYFVGFGSKEANFSTEKYPGHAFVAFGKGTPLSSSETGEYETWGFYGAADSHGEYLLVLLSLDVKGLFYQDNIINPDLFFYINVPFEEYLKALMIKENFIKNTKDYDLYKRNCVSYAHSVAQTLQPRINVPPKDRFVDVPTEYLRELIRLNKKSI